MLISKIQGYTVQTRIKEYRSHLSMTQDDLARKVGVRRETIVFLEQGKYNPSLKLAHDVSRALHAGIDDLFIFDDGYESESTEQRIILID
jgi:putative transcriptional regulator